jgi:nicotinate-nucleotide adenylyltransferase
MTRAEHFDGLAPHGRRAGLPCRPGLRVGLLGGSFNPAHDGHLHISRLALQRLGLDQVWWLVSPQNPLKSKSGMAPLKQRLATANAVASDSRVRVTDIESRLGTRFTVDTLAALKGLFPRTSFVWILGADNLSQMPRWRHWQALMKAVPIAVVGRPTYSLRALSGLVARRYRRQRVSARHLADRHPPAWGFISGPLHAGSATAIRRAAESNQEHQELKRSNSS